MIRPGEIQQKANRVGVRDQQIEKDYILSWILFGVSKHSLLSRILVFKGGTVLKKVYFDDYRYSEDLDFTFVNDEEREIVVKSFEETFDFIREEANIPLQVVDQNEHIDGGMNFYISYVGPLGGQRANKKVKVDISKGEKLVFEPVQKEVIINYTDLEKHNLLCYSLEEILIEKLRSTIQRMQPRDFYDIWYLLEHHEMDLDFYTNEFKVKCTSRQVDPQVFHKNLEKRIPQYASRWEKSMRNQIQNLPDFEQVEREIKRHLRGFMIG